MRRGTPGLIGLLAEEVRDAGPGPPLLFVLIAGAAVLCLGGGAIGLESGGRFAAGAAIVGWLCVLGLASGRLSVTGSRAAWAGAGLLGGLAAWSSLSILWSIAPDGSWLAANRTFAYAIVAAVTLIAAASTKRAPVGAALGLGAAALLVAACGLAYKVAPGLELGAVGFDSGGRFSRLSEPVSYWNALALVAVMGCPACIWLTAHREAKISARVVSFLCLCALALTIALTYSRGGVVAYAVALSIMCLAGPRGFERLLAGVAAPIAMGPAMFVAFSRDDLSTGGVPLGDRVDGGLLLGAMILVCLISAAIGTRALIGADGAPRFPRPDFSSNRRRAVAAGAVAAVLAGAIAFTISGGEVPAEIGRQADQFSDSQGGLPNAPNRFISANTSGRTAWWKEAAEAWADAPLEGRGAGSFPTIHYLYREEEAPVRSSHSLPLMFLSETGLVGLLLGGGGLALLLVAAIARVRKAQGPERSARLTLLAAFCSWLAASLFDWHWEIPAVTVAALVAVCVAAAPTPRQPARHARRLSVPGAVAGSLAVAALFISALLPVRAEELRRRALVEAGKPRPDLVAAERDAALAERLNPLSVEPLFTRAALASARLDTLAELGFLGEASRLQPDNWEVWRRLLTAYSESGYLEQAAVASLEWFRTDPYRTEFFKPLEGALTFSLRHPPEASPTALGTPAD